MTLFFNLCGNVQDHIGDFLSLLNKEKPGKGDSIIMSIDSTGGLVASGAAFISAIDTLVENGVYVELVATGSINSTAFDIFIESAAFKKLTINSMAVIHFASGGAYQDEINGIGTDNNHKLALENSEHLHAINLHFTSLLERIKASHGYNTLFKEIQNGSVYLSYDKLRTPTAKANELFCKCLPVEKRAETDERISDCKALTEDELLSSLSTK